MPYIDTLTPKREILDYWKDRLWDVGVFCDWGEPSCWGCGFHYGARYDIKWSNASWDEIYALWDRVPLQRCHLKPRSLGGRDEPSNLFLMCRECHDLAPNSPYPDVFFRWVRGQSAAKRDTARMDEALRSFGVERTDTAFLKLISSAQFRDWMTGRAGIHRPQSNYGYVAARLTPATIVGLAVHYRDEVLGRVDGSSPGLPGAGLRPDAPCQ